MKRFLYSITALLLILLNSIVLTGNAQVINTKITANPTVDAKRLQYIDDVINQYISKNWLTGCVTIIVKDNQVVQYKGYGVLDTDAKQPMQNDALFRIMSQTKAITSTAILMLYDQGKFYLDEPIADFIPAFKNPVVLDHFNKADTTYTTVPAKRDITFRDLLTHTSGIDYADIGTEEMKAIYTKAGVPSGLGYFNANLLEKMNVLAKLPLKNQPGEKFLYGLNTDLLGCLVEVISGTTLDAFMRKNIFEPLGMKDTYFNVPAEKSNRLAAVYTEDNDHHIIKWPHDFRHIDPDYPKMDKHYFSGGAGLTSTALDYAIFLQMIMNKGKYNGHQILAPRTAELMISPQLEPGLLGDDNFGLGFQITSQKTANKKPRHAGSFAWGGYYGTTYWADPQSHLICLLLTQHTPNSHGDIAVKFENLVYSSLK
ncbi:MAG: beta-lactamase family protein [Bacteroidetes bacterium]|nr:beta-lactamase family protein [Bacteroidota bacterium]